MIEKDLKIEKIKLTDISPSENLTRDIDDEGLRVLDKSINEFGLVEPILINLKSNNLIISGHQRYHILYNKYRKGEIPDTLSLISFGDIGWVFINENLELDSLDSQTQLSILLNSHQGKWVKKELKKTLKDLKLKGFDLELTGMDNIELEELDSTGDLEDLDDSPKLFKCPQCGCEFNLGEVNV